MISGRISYDSALDTLAPRGNIPSRAPSGRHHFYAQEANLNLLSRSDLRDAAREAGLENFHIEAVRLGPWASNLILIAYKK